MHFVLLLISALRRWLGLDRGFQGLKREAEIYAAHDDHYAYEKALLNYDTDIRFDFSRGRCEFLGAGKGRYTLNSYRKLYMNGDLLFEKIYLLRSMDWRKCEYFYARILPRMESANIRVPTLVASSIGRRLAVVRFEYVDFKPVDIELYLDQVLSITRELASLGSEFIDLPSDFRDLTLHFGFERCFQKSLSVFGRDDAKVALLRSMRKHCEALPRFIGHGDLSRPNMGGEGLVLDWDNFGLYPPGFDLALALILTGKLYGQDELASFARKGHEAVQGRCTFEECWFSLVFLYGTFLSARKAEHKIYCFDLLESWFLASGRETVVMN